MNQWNEWSEGRSPKGVRTFGLWLGRLVCKIRKHHNWLFNFDHDRYLAGVQDVCLTCGVERTIGEPNAGTR